MIRNAWPIALVVALASTAAFDGASAKHYVYVRDFNYSVNPRGQVEGRFSPSVARACKFADKNKKYSGPGIVAVARFPCKDGNFVNQFVVAK
jgi:hypothetical protein